jgi:hypothetical protein
MAEFSGVKTRHAINRLFLGVGMNWQTKEILERAKREINDEGVFSSDQISRLIDLVNNIGKAIDKESDCNKPSHPGSPLNSYV